ncbi:MAG: ATP-binding protein [Deltaproteobacteria bacterium]
MKGVAQTGVETGIRTATAPPSEAMLRALPVPALGIDREGRLCLINEAAEKLLGWREIELKDRCCADALFLPKHRDCSLRELARLIDGESRSRSATLRCADGRTIDAHIRASPIRDDAGWIQGAIVVIDVVPEDKDESQAVLAAGDIARALAQVPFLDRLSELIVDRLGHADRMRGDFLATMSHELRTPLHVILGYTGLLREGAFGELPEAHNDPLARIERRAHELHNLITNTLSLSRLESEAGALAVEPVALGGLLSELIHEAERLRDQGEARISLEVVSDLPVIETDISKLTIILRNLLSNALKFTDAGWVRVTASGEDTGVVVEVEDSGVGMAAEEVTKLFEAYTQGDVGRARGGVGLGLFIVQELSVQLGGSIQVDSEPGRGSRFELHLPLKAPAGQAI